MQNTTTMDVMRRIECALSSIRVPAVPGEYDIHDMIAMALSSDDIDYRHEAPLAPRCRIDFLAEGVGIEVKKGKPARAAVLRQVTRYLESEQVEALILVSEKEIRLPAQIDGKMVKTLSLSRFWGVALP